MKHGSPWYRRCGHEIKMTVRGNAVSMLCAAAGLIVMTQYGTGWAQNCHTNPNAAQDRQTILSRSDIQNLPAQLKNRIGDIAAGPHSYLPVQAFAEADQPSLLFQYYILDTNGFEPNVFTTVIPGVNDTAMKTATGANCGLPTIGSVREVVEPKPGLPTDANDPRAFIDVFTDIAGLFVINNESGWYEGWMIHDLRVPPVAAPRSDRHAQFGTMTAEDAAYIRTVGTKNNVSGNVFTVDGRSPRLPRASDHFPNSQSNLVPIHLSMGAYNCMQQSDCHNYWEFNYETNWIHPLYELPFTGGFPDEFGGVPDAFRDGEIGRLQSIVPGSGPLGVTNDPRRVGDNPNLPRDPDRFEADNSAQREFRQRFIPSGLANEILLDVYVRRASFMPQENNLNKRLFHAYAEEVRRVDANGDGIISAVEGDIDTASDGFRDNSRLFLPATAFNRFAVTREINDGLLAPRFAPSQRAWVLQGSVVPVVPPVGASAGRDTDDR